MKTRHLLAGLVLAVLLAGCSSSDVPVQTVQVKEGQVPTQSMKGGVQANPNIPQAAKDALLHQNGK